MKISINQSRATVPEAFVTKGRQRVKQFGRNVYLRNGEEFEIELFNPTQSKVLAKIKLNGEYISSSGIVMRPGERVFLERYFDEARKFLFETYEVDGNNPNVREAIRRNGDVEVEFYQEYQPNQYTITYSPGSWTWQPSIYTGTPAFTYTSANVKHSRISGARELTGESVVVDLSDSIMCCNTLNEQSLETGSVEKGNYSGQSFGTDYSTYNSYYSWKSTWKILPDSQRPIMKESLVVYCSNCGAKRKKSSHKFCPHCGNQF